MKQRKDDGPTLIASAQAFVILFSTVFASLYIGSIVKTDRGCVCVIVDSALHPKVQSAVGQYAEDLRSEGYRVSVISSFWSSPQQLRDYLRLKWASEGLVGTVMIGGLPVAWYEMSVDPANDGARSIFPIDLYFTDLDGFWEDVNLDKIFDGHFSGKGDLEPEIWLGRIRMSSAAAPEHELVNAYLAKAHAWRQGGLTLPKRALLYLDDDWTGEMGLYLSGLESAYDDTRVVTGIKITNATDYAHWLGQGYDWVQVHTHSNAALTGHTFKVTDGVDQDGDGVVDNRGEGGTVTSLEIKALDPAANFYNVFTCGAADYALQDYLCGWYVFAPTHGLCAIGSTKSGGMLNHRAFYDSIGNGQTIGQAFKRWFVENGERHLGQELSRSWFYGLTIIGDPTLAPFAARAAPMGPQK